MLLNAKAVRSFRTLSIGSKLGTRLITNMNIPEVDFRSYILLCIEYNQTPIMYRAMRCLCSDGIKQIAIVVSLMQIYVPK